MGTRGTVLGFKHCSTRFFVRPCSFSDFVNLNDVKFVKKQKPPVYKKKSKKQEAEEFLFCEESTHEWEEDQVAVVMTDGSVKVFFSITIHEIYQFI